MLPAILRQEPVVAWVVDDTGFLKKDCAVAFRSRTTILRTSGQAGTLPRGCKPFGDHREGEYARSVPSVLARDVDQGQKTAKENGSSEEISFKPKPNIALEQIQRARKEAFLRA